MDQIWIIYTTITVTYIVILILFFWRRARKHERELKDFLGTAKNQLEKHKKIVHDQSQQKITKVVTAMSILQKVAQELDVEIRNEYARVIQSAQSESEVILSAAKSQANSILENSTHDLDDYRAKRIHEIESDLVKLVMNVTEKVVGSSLTYQDHVGLIYKALEDVKQQKLKN